MFYVVQKNYMRQPGVEPGLSRPQREVLTTILLPLMIFSMNISFQIGSAKVKRWLKHMMTSTNPTSSIVVSIMTIN